MGNLSGRPWRRLLALLSIAALGACGGGGDDTPPPTQQAQSGSMRVAITDAPTCGYDAVHVSIAKVRVHKSGGAAETDAGWSEIVLSPARRVELLSLNNGVLAELGQVSLETGRYQQMRLVLAANDATTPLANSVTPTGSAQVALNTPSALQSGLKLNLDVEVAANQVADLVLDFDACKSVVRLGNSGGFNLKPVVAVLPRVTDLSNRIVGHVSTAIAATTTVSAQQAGVPIKSTVPDSTGRFVLTPLPAGTYDVVVVANGRAAALVTGVPVSSSAVTTLNASTAVIDPPLSPQRLASGSVTIMPSPLTIEAIVVARKAFAGGPTVEIAAQPVNGVSGVFSLSLASAAPMRAVYASTGLAFALDTATPTGQYLLVATTGTTSKTLSADVSTADATGLAFTFP